MKADKIFKGIIALGTLAGTAYISYKHGEFVGADKEKSKRVDDNIYFDFENDDEMEDYNFYDEPDVKCFSPVPP